MGELSGQVAIVTGSGQGIGLGIAKVLARNGASIVLTDVFADRLRSATETLAGAQLIAVTADISEPSDVRRLVAETIQKFGTIDILVNNAGRAIYKSALEHTDQDWSDVLGTNLTGVFLCSREVLRHMIERRSGKIVNIASLAAFHYTADHVAYAASKAGVVALTREMAYEFGPLGIRVNAIAPGPTQTPLTQAALTDQQRAALAKTLRLGRWGRPEDIGEATAFLVSDRASFITGAVLNVAGGADLGGGTFFVFDQKGSTS